jgi:hypothetical protein
MSGSPDRTRWTYYVSEVVDLPPVVALAAFDALVLPGITDLASAGGARLRVRRVARPPTPPCSPSAPMRAEPALLRAGWRRMSGELELSPWSTGRTEIGLRPRRWGMSTWPSEACLNAAGEVLAELACQLQGLAVRPAHIPVPRARIDRRAAVNV